MTVPGCGWGHAENLQYINGNERAGVLDEHGRGEIAPRLTKIMTF